MRHLNPSLVLPRALVLLLTLWSVASFAETPDWQLSDVCPAGFRPSTTAVDPAPNAKSHNYCELVSLYDGYESLQNAGVGGPQTGLPKYRSGFTAEQIDLGRLLFFDPLLSADHTVACASCHHPAKGFSDGLAFSQGIHGKTTDRSAPTLWNVAFLETLFWDARATSLEEQSLGPLYSAHEMGNTREQLLADLGANENYQKLFTQAFEQPALTLDNIYTAIAAFQSSLISLNSRYDLYAAGVHDILTPKEIEGMNVFRSFVARCAECHTPPTFTNQQIAVIGAPEPDGRPLDPGLQAITGDPSHRGGFKVPTLRNIALTAPYMHSGRFKTLRETVAFYTGGRGHAVPEGEKLSIHWHLWDPKLKDYELDRLVDFLHTLTDESLMPVIPHKLPSGLTPVAHDSRSTPVNQ